MMITGNFERFHYFNFETNFLKSENLFVKTAAPIFYLKVIRWKTQPFHTRLPCHNSMFKQIEQGAQSERNMAYKRK